MGVFKDENDLKNYLKKKIECMPYYKNVWKDINLASRKFYSQGRKSFTKDPSEYLFPLAQPEIDLIVRDADSKLLAIQVKYLKFETNHIFPTRPKPTYYEGIEQILATLNFGFNCVSLWHCFDFEGGRGSLADIHRYADATHELISVLNLPINYFALWISKREDIFYISPSWYENRSGFKLLPGLPSLYGKKNPLQSIPQVKKMNEFLRKTLDIPLAKN